MTRAEQIAQGRAALANVAHELEAEELQVMVYLARRLREGQRQYGPLDVARDRRDFERERSDELADALVYTAIAELRRVVRGKGPIE